MSENSFIAILNRMKSRITTEADRREGTWTADNLQAVANELARVYAEDIEDILPQAFVATAVGKNLDSACSDNPPGGNEGRDGRGSDRGSRELQWCDRVCRGDRFFAG